MQRRQIHRQEGRETAIYREGEERERETDTGEREAPIHSERGERAERHGSTGREERRQRDMDLQGERERGERQR